MVEVLFGLGELVLGFGFGFAWERTASWLYPAGVAGGIAICVVVVIYAAVNINPCLPGADCDATTWANWALLGLGTVGFWLLSVAMGYAVATRFDADLST